MKTSIRNVVLITGPVFYVAMIIAYLWFGHPRAQLTELEHVAVWTLLIVWPLASNLFSGLRFNAYGFRQTGLRTDNLFASLKLALPLTAIFFVAILATGLANESLRMPPLDVILYQSLVYLAFGPAQQFLLNGYVVHHFRLARLAPPVAIVLAAVLFAAAHAPNVLLMTGTFILGVSFATVYARVPNVLTLGLLHSFLAICVYWMLPPFLHHALAVGARCCPS